MNDNTNYGEQTYSIIVAVILFLLLASYNYLDVKLFSNVTFLIIVCLFITLIYFLALSIMNADYSDTSALSPEIDKNNRSYYRGIINATVASIIVIFISFFVSGGFVINPNFFITWGLVFYMILVFFMDRIFALDIGLEKLKENVGDGIWFGFQSVATGSFLRYVLIIFVYVFITLTMTNILSNPTASVKNQLLSKNRRVYSFIAHNITPIVQSFIGILVFVIYINTLKFRWAFPNGIMTNISSYEVFITVILAGFFFMFLDTNRIIYFIASLVLMFILTMFNISDVPDNYDVQTEINNSTFFGIDPGYLGVTVIVLIIVFFIYVHFKTKKIAIISS